MEVVFNHKIIEKNRERFRLEEIFSFPQSHRGCLWLTMGSHEITTPEPSLLSCSMDAIPRYCCRDFLPLGRIWPLSLMKFKKFWFLRFFLLSKFCKIVKLPSAFSTSVRLQPSNSSADLYNCFCMVISTFSIQNGANIRKKLWFWKYLFVLKWKI